MNKDQFIQMHFLPYRLTFLILMLIIYDSTAQTEQTILFKGANLIPMTSDTIYKDFDLMVKGSEIEAIGKNLNKPKGVIQVNARGKYIIPGLADMHVHIERFENEEDLRLFPLYGVTTVRNMDGRKKVLEWRKKINERKIMGPQIYTAGKILEGNNPFWDDTQVVTDSAMAANIVSAQFSEGYDFIKVYHTLGKEAYSAVVEAARRNNSYVSGHTPNGVGIWKVLAERQKSIEHFDGYLEEMEADTSPFKERWTWLKMYFAVPIDDSKMKVLVDSTVKYKVWNVPTLVQTEKIAPLATIEEWYESEQMQIVPDYILKEWAPENFEHLKYLDKTEQELLKQGRINRFKFLKELYDRSSLILAGTDTPNPFVIPGYSLTEELALFVEAGLSPYQALKSATVDSALFTHCQNWGTLEEGKRADLVVLDANPLEKIENLEEISGVMVNGLWLDEHEREELLQELKKS